MRGKVVRYVRNSTIHGEVGDNKEIPTQVTLARIVIVVFEKSATPSGRYDQIR